MIKQFIKSAMFVVVFHLLSVVNILLLLCDIYGDIGSIVYQLILSLIAIPLYFFIKNESVAPWMYSFIAVVSHIIFSLITFLCGGTALGDSVDVLRIFFLEIINLCTFSIIFLMDIFVNIKTK